ncbi:TM221 protein, partial [Paradoxornis webbianus]|nr:TM221 protein [Sinosuthora webbiana]
ALALFSLLLFEPGPGIASASVLSSGILLLLLSALHALLGASRNSQKSQNSRQDLPQALHDNDPAQGGDLGDKNSARIRREFSFPFFPEGKSRPGSASGSDLSLEFRRDLSRDLSWDLSRDLSRTHRTLSEDSGLLREKGKTWNVVAGEMRDATGAWKKNPGGKDSTLV